MIFSSLLSGAGQGEEEKKRSISLGKKGTAKTSKGTWFSPVFPKGNEDLERNQDSRARRLFLTKSKTDRIGGRGKPQKKNELSEEHKPEWHKEEGGRKNGKKTQRRRKKIGHKAVVVRGKGRKGRRCSGALRIDKGERGHLRSPCMTPLHA